MTVLIEALHLQSLRKMDKWTFIRIDCLQPKRYLIIIYEQERDLEELPELTKMERQEIRLRLAESQR
jgi:hypothetical protein